MSSKRLEVSLSVLLLSDRLWTDVPTRLQLKQLLELQEGVEDVEDQEVAEGGADLLAEDDRNNNKMAEQLLQLLPLKSLKSKGFVLKYSQPFSLSFPPVHYLSYYLDCRTSSLASLPKLPQKKHVQL